MKVHLSNNFSIENIYHTIISKINLTPLQKKTVYIFVAFLSLLAAASLFYFTYFKNKKVGRISNPSSVQLHSMHTASQKLFHTHLTVAQTRYRGNVMESLPATLSDTKNVFMDEKIDVIGIVDTDAMHIGKLGFKQTYSNFRNPDPSAIKNGYYSSDHELDEINLEHNSQNMLLHFLRLEAIKSRSKQHFIQTKNPVPQLDCDQLISDTFSRFFAEMVKYDPKNSYISYKPKGGVLAAISEDKIWINHLGKARCILIKNTIADPSTVDFFDGVEEINGSIPSRSSSVISSFRLSEEQKISSFPRDSYKGGHLLMASGKFFEYFTESELADAIQAMEEKKFSLEEMTKHFTLTAVSKGLNDFFNISIVKL